VVNNVNIGVTAKIRNVDIDVAALTLWWCHRSTATVDHLILSEVKNRKKHAKTALYFKCFVTEKFGIY